MANERNVEALEKLLIEFRERLSRFDTPRYLANWLAERGVLVPGALTDDEVADLWDMPPNHANLRREALERVAKGED